MSRSERLEAAEAETSRAGEEETASKARARLEAEHPPHQVRWRSLAVPTYGYPHSASTIAVAACEGGILILIHHIGTGQTSGGTTLSGYETELLLRTARTGYANAVKNVIWDQRDEGAVLLTRNHITPRDSTAILWAGRNQFKTGLHGDRPTNLPDTEAGTEAQLQAALADIEAGVVLSGGDQNWFRYALKAALEDARNFGTERIRHVA